MFASVGGRNHCLGLCSKDHLGNCSGHTQFPLSCRYESFGKLCLVQSVAVLQSQDLHIQGAVCIARQDPRDMGWTKEPKEDTSLDPSRDF